MNVWIFSVAAVVFHTSAPYSRTDFYRGIDDPDFDVDGQVR